MLRSVARWRRAVSPLISDILLTGIVVVAMTLLLTWATWYAYSHPSKMAVKERFAIEHVWFNFTGPVITEAGVYIYNFGKVSITVDRVYINDVDVTDDIVTDESKLSYAPGESGKVVIDLSDYNWGEGTYWVKVVTERGTHVQKVVTALAG